MARYADVEKLIDYKFAYITNERYKDGKRKSEKEIYAYKVGYNEAIDNIMQFAPTADAVEVVRCGDCKYHDDIDAPGMVHCPNVIGGWVSERFFCAGGERRESGAKQD